MGIGGNFWDLVKPYARNEGFNFLRNKRVAVDLSFWIVQHETAIKGFTRNPHIRLTFFRTINLFSKFGAYPVFILDGTPSPLKSQARIARFYRSSGVELSSFPEAEEGISVERNRAFTKCVRECVELLELLGMPILKAKGEAEALCAELNSEGYVDACITADSDAFLYGAHCVIKKIQPNSKEPFECYYISDIEAGLALKRKHLIAVSLLVGNDYDLNGIMGIGVETAVRFVKCFSDDEVLDKLHEIARQDLSEIQGTTDSVGKASSSPGNKSPKPKSSHCSHCGHPGNKKAHFTLSCECCNSTAGTSCFEKPVAFKCNCPSCDLYRKEKERKKNEAWRITVCRKIASERNSVKDEIIQIYLKKHHGVDDDPCIGWATPRMEMLIDYLAYHQHWEPSYIRQRLLPMLSTLYLRNMASKPTKNLLHGQYEFHCVQRVKTRYGHQCYVVNWKKAGTLSCGPVHIVEETDLHDDSVELDIESLDEEPDVPSIHIGDDVCFLSTDEDMELVRNAFPEEVGQFLKEKELKAMKSQKKKSNSGLVGTPEGSKLSASRSTQLSIKEFYRASKGSRPIKTEAAEDSLSCCPGKRKESSTSLSKSARRKLLFG